MGSAVSGWILFPLCPGAPDRTRSPDNPNHFTVDRWEKGTVFAVDQDREDGGGGRLEACAFI